MYLLNALAKFHSWFCHIQITNFIDKICIIKEVRWLSPAPSHSTLIDWLAKLVINIVSLCLHWYEGISVMQMVRFLLRKTNWTPFSLNYYKKKEEKNSNESVVYLSNCAALIEPPHTMYIFPNKYPWK